LQKGEQAARVSLSLNSKEPNEMTQRTHLLRLDRTGGVKWNLGVVGKELTSS